MVKGKFCIELMYDVISPFSRNSFEILKRYRPIWNFKLIMKPISIAKVMQGSGNSPPVNVPLKFKNNQKDIIRNSKFMNIESSFPKKFPISTSRPMKLLTALSISSDADADQHLEDLSGIIFEQMFVHHADIREEYILRKACSKLKTVSDDEINKWIDSIESKEVEEALDRKSKEAINRGVFGVPTIFITPNQDSPNRFTSEMFFGCDRFEQIAFLYNLPYYGPNPKLHHNNK